MSFLKLSIAILVALSSVMGAAQAAVPGAMEALAQKNNCLACHSVTARVVGPAYLDVAKKYAGKPEALDVLTQKVLKGGSGTWGPVAMPANMQVSAEDAKLLVRWVLSLKP